MTSISDCVFKDCSALTSVTIPNSVTKIGNGAFQGCSNLISVTIPNSVTRIGGRAFESCSSLISIAIPNSVKWIYDYAFLGCSSLTSIAIPNSVTMIQHQAFAKCPNLENVYSYAESVPSTLADLFSESYIEYATLHVPAASVNDYSTTEPWKSFGNIVPLTAEELGIEGISVDNNSNTYYDLNGRRLNDAPAKGLYIQNGKKVMIK